MACLEALVKGDAKVVAKDEVRHVCVKLLGQGFLPVPPIIWLAFV